MKKLLLLIMILVLYIPLSLYSANSKAKVLKPKNVTTKIKTLISGKSRIYYPLSFQNPTIITTKGPGKLEVITRVCFDSKAEQSLDYRIYYRINGANNITEYFNDVKKSLKASFLNGLSGAPGIGKNVIIDLGIGEHTIEIWQAAENPKVAARYLFTKTKKKKYDWVSLSPLYPNEPVNLITNEDLIQYYRFSESKPLRVRVMGPTTLRILNRIENHYHMKGRINYRIQVKEDGNIKNTYLLNSIRSEVTSYKKGGSKIPGKAKEIIIDVPKGRHTYEIIPLDKDKSTVLGRVLFPKKDVKLGD